MPYINWFVSPPEKWCSCLLYIYYIYYLLLLLGYENLCLLHFDLCGTQIEFTKWFTECINHSTQFFTKSLVLYFIKNIKNLRNYYNSKRIQWAKKKLLVWFGSDVGVLCMISKSLYDDQMSSSNLIM